MTKKNHAPANSVLQVIWALNIGRDGVERSVLTSEFSQAGLPVPATPSAEALLTRASQRIAVGRSWLGQKRLDTGAIGLVSHRTDQPDLEPEHFATVGVDTTGVLQVTHSGLLTGRELEAADAFRSAVSEAEVYATATDLRVILRRVILGSRTTPGWAAAPVVGNGVQAYWVPMQFERQAIALRDLIREVSPQSRFDVLQVSIVGSNLDVIRSHVEASALDDLAQLRAELAELDKEGGVSERSFGARVERVKTLKERVELWGDVLGDMVEKMVEDLVAEQERLRAMVTEGSTRTVDPDSGLRVTASHNALLAQLSTGDKSVEALKAALDIGDVRIGVLIRELRAAGMITVQGTGKNRVIASV